MSERIEEYVCACISDNWGPKYIPRLGEEIVRCRDCVHYTDNEWVIATDVEHVCHFWHGEPTKVEPGGFCAWGERKDA